MRIAKAFGDMPTLAAQSVKIIVTPLWVS